MKLLNYTTLIFSGILFLLLSLWAVLFYFEMLDEIYDSLDDGLENQKMLVIQKVMENPELRGKSFQENNFRIEEIPRRQALGFTDAYRDTLLFMQNERDYEPARLLESVFEMEGKYYSLMVVTSMVEEDDLVKELFFSLLWLYCGLILSIVLLNSLLHRKIWKPFYKLLSQLGNFSLEKDTPVRTVPTRIVEFQLLNTQIEKLLRRSVDTYNSQKEFIENTSHELQTPLAISINKLELLVENNHFTEPQLEELGSVIDNLERLTRFNRSLLLLSKIENQQFPELETINFNQLVRELATEFQDLAEHRNLELEIKEGQSLQHRMNRDLATILVSNLLKNALLHGNKGSKVEVEFLQNRLQISNSGVDQALDPESLSARFRKTGINNRSNGLGLSIAKAIADRFGLDLSYAYTGKHVFRLDVK